MTSLLPAGIGIYASRIDRHSRASGNPDTPRQYWIPACAGMTVGCCGAIGRFLQNHWVDELCRYPCFLGVYYWPEMLKVVPFSSDSTGISRLRLSHLTANLNLGEDQAKNADR